ncbi:hypothetical protein MKW92_008534 [Papaver armeniacum]|nr:hypothetical protein MKW92_008534 [Papaver armeniacum]
MLTGEIPAGFWSSLDLAVVLINDNMFYGHLPEKLSSNLIILNLANNNFGGSIPTGIGSLQILSLRANKFSGSIPENITHLQDLQILDLSLNNLSGHIPNGLGNLSGFVSNAAPTSGFGIQFFIKGIKMEIKNQYNYSSTIDLSCNSLRGNIPKDIGLLKQLYSLNLSHNHLTNDIPESVGNLSALESLDLSSNKLSGHIPQSLTTIDNMAVLNLSYNELSGRIPRGAHFDTLSVDGSAFSGNELLCGYPIKKLCEGDRNTSINDANPTNDIDEDDGEDEIEKFLIGNMLLLPWGLELDLGVFLYFSYLKRSCGSHRRFVNSIAVRIVNYFENN